MGIEPNPLHDSDGELIIDDDLEDVLRLLVGPIKSDELPAWQQNLHILQNVGSSGQRLVWGFTIAIGTI